MVPSPCGKKPSNEIISGNFGAKVPVDAMITANHRAKNLGDLFSIRNIEMKPAPPSPPTQFHSTFRRAIFATTIKSQSSCQNKEAENKTKTYLEIIFGQYVTKFYNNV